MARATRPAEGKVKARLERSSSTSEEIGASLFSRENLKREKESEKVEKPKTFHTRN